MIFENLLKNNNNQKYLEKMNSEKCNQNLELFLQIDIIFDDSKI